MKTRHTYLLLLVVFLAATAFVISKYYLDKEKTSVRYALQPRQGILANSPEWTTTKQLAYRLNKILQSDPGNSKAALQLVTLFIREARVTANYMYYDAAALKYLKNILTKEPKNVEALVLESVIYLSQHHFAEGLEIAQRARQLNPHFAFTYGLLVDGNVEMGNYKTAVENSDQMVSIRPDLRSYSRISYLREIYGDDNGAIEAMKMAVDAGQNGDESTEWARVQLAKLYENRGDLKSAEMYYTIALDNRPGYAPAIAGLGHIAMGHHDYTKAIHLYQQAAQLLPDYSIHYQLASLYFLRGEKEKAEAIVKKSII
jgi:tetratricopeptide (TPR) repeat protein